MEKIMETTNASAPQLTRGRRTLFKTLLGAAFAAASLLSGCGSDDDSASSRAYATWAASPSDYNATNTTTGVTPTALTFTNKTLRHTMQTSLAGDQLRVRFSNVFGKAALAIAGAHVALATGGAAIDASSDKAITIGGQQAFSVPAGTEAWSDPVPLSTSANANLAVSVYVSAATPAATYHALGRQTTYIVDGNQLAAPTITGAETRQNYFWVNGIDVYSQRDANVLVPFGDSITDGFNSTVDANRRYPNVLARRFSADASAKPVSVVNAGISGNRVLTDTSGPKGVDRFERDVLGQSGVTHTIILLGINDIGFCGLFGAAQCVTADQITAGLASMVDKAKARGVKVYLATLTPFKGTTIAGYYNDAGEVKRQAVNAWIRANKAVDGVIDFDKAVQNPADPLSLLPAWDSGDHLHPNDAGYEAMANSIDLALFR
jgi:lysophospholipase L1-like esterase